MNTLFHAAIIAAVIAFCARQDIIGRWESKPSAAGNVTGVVFKADHTYTAYVNQKPFANGTYSWADSLLSIKENGCEYKGTYKTVFFAANDSLKLQPVVDSCTDRAKGISKLVLGRVN